MELAQKNGKRKRTKEVHYFELNVLSYFISILLKKKKKKSSKKERKKEKRESLLLPLPLSLLLFILERIFISKLMRAIIRVQNQNK